MTTILVYLGVHANGFAGLLACMSETSILFNQCQSTMIAFLLPISQPARPDGCPVLPVLATLRWTLQ